MGHLRPGEAQGAVQRVFETLMNLVGAELDRPGLSVRAFTYELEPTVVGGVKSLQVEAVEIIEQVLSLDGGEGGLVGSSDICVACFADVVLPLFCASAGSWTVLGGSALRAVTAKGAKVPLTDGLADQVEGGCLVLTAEDAENTGILDHKPSARVTTHIQKPVCSPHCGRQSQ